MSAGFWHPAWRSRPNGHRQLRLWRFLSVGVVTLLAPALAALLLAVAFGTVTELSGQAFETGEAAAVMGAWATVLLLTAFAPIYGILLVPVAMVLLIVAMRFGHAGWGVALLAGLGIAVLLAAMFAAAGGEGNTTILSLFATPVVLVHAIVLWVSARWLLPDAFLVPDR